jgi:hypothetical protein
MAVSTSFVPLGSSWTALNAASTTPNMIMAKCGPIEIIASSSGVPAAGTRGILINPETWTVTPIGFATVTPYVLYAMAASSGQTGVGVSVVVGG